jgi:hypothetical protein
MNNLRTPFFVLFISILFCKSVTVSYGQAPVDTSVVDVSEILIPQCEKIKHQKNLYYEVYTSQDHFPSPSYWYKMVFIRDCSFRFSLFPLYEEDTYDLYCFKVVSDMDVCNAIADNKMVACNAERIYKDYADEEVKNKAESKFIDLTEVKVKAGDAIYIEIFSTSGKDCGHILEFKTGSSFFVCKLINKKCPARENYGTDSTIPVKQYQTVQTETEAIDILSKTFCKIQKEELMITSIKVSNHNASFNPGLDFVSYARKDTNKKEMVNNTVIVPPPAVPVIPAPIAAAPAMIPKSINTEIIAKKDSVIPAPKTIQEQPKKEIVQKEVPQTILFKSTADLEENTPSVSNKEPNQPTANSLRHSRLLADKTLFSTLLNEVEGKIKTNEKELKSEKKELSKDIKKKTITKEEKTTASNSIKDLRQQNLDLKIKLRDIKTKLRTIEKLLEQSKHKS